MSSSSEFDIVLASASPRRKDLMQKAGIEFRIHAVDVDETLTPQDEEDPEAAVKKLSERKGHAAVEELIDEHYRGDMVVVAADTIVVRDGKIFGKPIDEADARRMLSILSGRTHTVFTGVSLWFVHAGEGDDFGIMYRTFVDASYVTFDELTDEQIDAYIATGEPLDKAGAYGLQGLGAALVKDVDGSFNTVIGLPVERLLSEYPEVFDPQHNE